jgi:hypothetical protein
MISDILENESCKWCGRRLAKTFLTGVTLGIEKGDTILYPVLCLCGGITVVGAGTLISHFDGLSKHEGDSDE